MQWLPLVTGVNDVLNIFVRANVVVMVDRWEEIWRGCEESCVMRVVLRQAEWVYEIRLGPGI